MITNQYGKPGIKLFEVGYIQLFNDFCAVFYVCVVCAFDNVSHMESVAMVLLAASTLINCYLSNRGLGLIFLWSVAFYGFCLMSIFWAVSVETSNRLLTYVIRTMVLAVLMSIYLHDERSVRIVFKSIILGTGILSIRLFMDVSLADLGRARLGAASGFNENYIGMVYIYASTVCLCYVKKSNFYSIVYLFFSVMTLLSGSRKAFVILLLVVIIFYFSRIKKPSNLLYIIPVGGFVILIIYLVMNNEVLYQMMGRRMEGILFMITGEGDAGRSTLIRKDLIDTGLQQFTENPIIGYGMNNYRFMSKYNLYAHNNFIELLVDYGIIGFALYYTLPVVLLYKSCVMWITKTKEVFISIIFMVIFFVNDYGVVSYYSSIVIIIMVASYRKFVLLDEQTV